MAAITWRNVDGPRLADPGRALESAGQTFNAGLQSLQNVLTARQATEAANVVQGRENLTQDFLGRMRQAGTREEFEAQQTGLNQEIAGYGAGIDRAAVGTAMDNRLGILDTRAQQAQVAQDSAKAAADRPIIDQIRFLQASGRGAEAQSMIAANPGLGQQAETAQFGNAEIARTLGIETAADRHTWAGNADTRATAASADTLLTNASTRRLNEANTSAANASRDRARGDRVEERELKARTAAITKLMEGNVFGQGSIDSTRNLDVTGKMINDYVKDEGEAGRMNRVVSRLSAEGGFDIGEGQRVGVPVALIRQAMQDSRDSNIVFGNNEDNWFFGSNRAANFEEIIRKRMTDPAVIADARAAHQINANAIQPAAGALGVRSSGQGAPASATGGGGSPGTPAAAWTPSVTAAPLTGRDASMQGIRNDRDAFFNSMRLPESARSSTTPERAPVSNGRVPSAYASPAEWQAYREWQALPATEKKTPR